MLDMTTVSSLEYYRDQDKDSRRETLQYHTDNETIDRGLGLMGVWEVLSDEGAEPLCKGIEQGGKVEWDIIEPLSRNTNPDTGEVYYNRKSEKAIVARDLTFSAPKPFSVLHGISKAASFGSLDNNAAMFRMIADVTLAAHQHGVRTALEQAHKEEAFAVRFGANGEERAGASYLAAARFDHFTSRDGDMQLHSHVVFPNVARAPDGKVKAWDNHKLTVLKGKLSAIYRTAAIDHAKRELAKHGIHVHFSRDGRNFRIDGIDKKVVDHFSKRRTKILNEMYAAGYTGTEKNRAAAQVVSYNTRRSKNELPPIEELYARWKFELNALGHTPESMVESVHETARDVEKALAEEWEKEKTKAVAEGRELPETRPDLDPEAIAKAAVKDITHMSATFQRTKFETVMLEHMQCVTDAETALATIERLRDEGDYVAVGSKGRSKEAVYTDKQTLMEEFELMELETKLRSLPFPIPSEFIEQAIAEGVQKNDGSGERFQLNAEQADLVRHLLSGGLRTDGIGDAGTGKTTTMIVVRRALELAEIDLHLAAPTNKAVTGLAKELGIPVERGLAVAGFIAGYRAGKIELGPKSFVIVDEAGMVSRAEALELARIADETGCKIAQIGDPKQLPPVQAGAPFRMVTEAFGAGRLKEIARQKEAWARQASKDLAGGKVRDGLMAYIDRGFLEIEQNADAVYDKAVETYTGFEGAEPGSTLMTAPTNAEVRMLARRVIEWKIENGHMTGPQYHYEHFSRGTDEVQSGLLMQGGIYALAETVNFEGQKYANNLVGRVIKIEDMGEGKEPFVTMRWEDGRECGFFPSRFVGYREQDDPKADIPRLAPADVLTDYQSQGLTFKNVVRPFTNATPTQTAYVAMTRHKENFVGIIDGGRIENDIAAKDGKTFTMEKSGASRQEDDVPNAEVTREQILEAFVKECERTNSKENACDFLGGAKEFHQNFRTHYEANFGLSNDLRNQGDREEKIVDQQEDKKPEAVSNEPRRNPFFPRGLGRIGGEVAADRTEKMTATANGNAGASGDESVKAKELQEIAERRKNSTAEPEIAKSAKVQQFKERRAANAKTNPRDRYDSKGPRITADEMAEFARIDLKSYIESHGGNIRAKYRAEGAAVTKGHEYKMEHPAIGNFLVTHFKSGQWGFMTYDRSLNGGIADFKAAVEGISKMQAYHALRAEFGTTPSEVVNQNFKPKVRIEETLTQKLERVLSEPITQGKDWIKKNWDDAKRGAARYLLDRGLSMDTLRRFADDMRLEGTPSRDGKNDGGVMFAMRSRDGELRGYTRKGTQIDPETGHPIARAAGGSAKYPVLMGERQEPARIYAGETVIDCMSLWQKDGSPERSLFLATSGNTGEKEQADIYFYAKTHRNAEWHYAAQNDIADAKGIKQNDVHRDQTREIVLAANPEAKFIERRPPEAVKDWNDVVKAEYQAEKAKQAQAAQKPTQKPEDQTEARRQGQNQNASQRPQNRPQEPSLAAQRGRGDAEAQKAREEAARKAQEARKKKDGFEM